MQSFGICRALLSLWMGLVLAAGGSSSCTAQSREDNVKEFLACLKANNEQKIYAVSYHINGKNNITDNELRKKNVVLASKALNKYLISSERRWRSQTFPLFGSRTLTIPLIAGSDSAVHATLILSFPPATLSDKVYDFEIFNNNTGGQITAPQRVN